MSNESIDKIDLQIISMLLEDSRNTFKNIADRVGLTSTSVASRVNSLYEQGVILQFTINLDYNKICNGMKYMIHLNISVGTLSPFLADLFMLGHIESVQIIAGKFNLMINTFPITPLALQELISIVQGSEALDFRICPIISKIESSSLPSNLIVDSAFCPQCHSRFEGEIITAKVNNNIMTFCCSGCIDAFQTAYNKILNTA